MKTWFQNLSLSRKQMLSLTCAGLIPMLAVALLCFFVAKQQIRQQAFSQLESIRQIKASAIERYAQQVENQLITLAASSSTIEGMDSMGNAFRRVVASEGYSDVDLTAMRSDVEAYYNQQFGREYQSRNQQGINVGPLYQTLPDASIALQHAYISDNQFPLGDKHQLNKAQGSSSYHRHHNQYHPNFRGFLEKFGYYDIFLVDIETGNIIYSVFKELDYATSLLDGPYSQTNFAEAFKRARALGQGQVVIEDYATYRPSYDAPASFAATPVFRQGEAIGVLIFQLPLEPINAIMGERAGMGQTGESYLIGKDRLMRSDSYLDPVNHAVQASFQHPEKGSVDTAAASAIIEGSSGNDIIIDYNGNPVLSSFAPLNFGDLEWGILAEIDVAEAFSGVNKLAYTLLALICMVTLVLVVSALYISKLIVTPILNLKQHIQDVQSSGDFKRKMDIQQKDEIGDISRTFSQLQFNLGDAFGKINQVLQELGKGNSDQTIKDYFAGDLGLLTDGVNQTAQQIHLAQKAQQEQAEIAEEKAREAETSAKAAKKQAQETLIIKQALDVSDTSVMIADTEFNIKYMNNAVNKLMKEREREIQESLPMFNAGGLLGSNVDQFHHHPSHQRQLLTGLSDTYKTEIKVSGLTFNLAATPIVDDSGNRLGTVIEWKDLTEQLAKEENERKIAQENLRIRQALDNSSTCTMIADKDQNIIYVNSALLDLMGNAESDIREQIGSFSSNNLIGQNIDTFHRNPSHQRKMLDNMKGVLKSEFEVGSRTLSITANAITNENGERTGTVVEWLDRTSEVAIEKEIAEIINAASNGDFAQRLSIHGKEGFFLRVSEGLNHIMEQTNTAVGDLVQLFASLSEGDLTRQIDRDYSGDFARLKQDANKTVTNLREIIDKIQHSSTLIARAADEISSGNQDLSSRTEEQASSLEETASSIEEITQIVRSSEDNSNKAASMTQKATEIAREGDRSVEQTSVAMNAIAEASNKIANIIGVIDEIAFQTNLLALNAAVEAARAGEQGRGFAVVAGEVRNLAQRSASAAKEIKSLIDDSVSKVSNGTELVQSSRRALASIVDEIDKVSKMMGDFTTSAREQTAGIEQVNTAVSQMDQMTQQNAALVEQASAASAAMAEQAASLQGMIQYFRR